MYAEFYENREIFFTGGSGVVGKAAIEKLLRSCNVKRIYILLRCKKGVSPEQRLDEIKKSKIFNVLNALKPNETDKLSVIPGDTGLDGLGISAQDREMMRNVSVFFHSAATTRFNEPLCAAIRYNVKSTLEALKLAETLPKLSIFIHVSTFFSNPYVKYVENKVYPPVFDWRVALKLLDDIEHEPVLDTITDRLIDGFPNTYLFTKHLAEQVVNEYRFKFPVCIYRPSIVVNAFEEPEPGFTESSVGVMGVMLVWGTGLMQVLIGRKEQQLDVTPLDYSVKVLLMSTVRAAQLPREKFEEATPISMLSSRGFLAFELGKQCEILTHALDKFAFQKSIWIPNVTLTSCPFVYYLITFLLQLVPSFLLDCFLRLAGQKPFFMAIQRKIFVTIQVLWFFLNTEYLSDGITNFEELERSGRGTDFSLSLAREKASSYENISDSCQLIAHGCRKYLMNEDDSTIVQAKRVLKCKKFVYNMLRGYVLYLILRKVYRMGMEYLGY